MNRLMRVTLLTFVVSLVGWGLIAVWAVWDEDPRAFLNELDGDVAENRG
jgi:hypothetical protein